MPPSVKVSKEDVITASLNMVRECGADALNARALATYIGCSTQPIFSNFSSMTELKQEVLKAADSIYQDFLSREMESGQYPPYKASGIGYIRFAKEEKELFKMLFMREREAEAINDEFDGATREIIEMMQKSIPDAKVAYYGDLKLYSYNSTEYVNFGNMLKILKSHHV